MIPKELKERTWSILVECEKFEIIKEEFIKNAPRYVRGRLVEENKENVEKNKEILLKIHQLTMDCIGELDSVSFLEDDEFAHHILTMMKILDWKKGELEKAIAENEQTPSEEKTAEERISEHHISEVPDQD